jgi:adenylate cyclase
MPVMPMPSRFSAQSNTAVHTLEALSRRTPKADTVTLMTHFALNRYTPLEINCRQALSMAEAHVERRLAAVLAADVAGYSRLMGIDEEGTLAALKAHRHELIDPKIAEHRGRIVKTTGDGALVEFASAVDAARCATEIQITMAERNASIPEGRRVEFRIGVNVGDVIIDEGDIYGDGVNIAARLESIAQPGGICISDDAYRQVRDKLDFNFQDLGEQELKNIARPVRVYRLHPPQRHPAARHFQPVFLHFPTSHPSPCYRSRT